MTLRTALYGRFSTDMQNPKSAGDQLVECRARADELGATIDPRHVFSDEAISGRHDNRPGLIALMAAARRREFDLVICESLDRLARSGGGTFDAYDDFTELGIRLHTVQRGDIDLTETAVHAMRNALDMEQLGERVRRGHRGVIRDGRTNGRPPYGYRRPLVHDSKGDRIKGLIAIDEAQAAVVRRIVADYLAGASIFAIVRRLNAAGEPGPQGPHWSYTSVAGHGAASGILRNPIYAGVVVWGKTREVKNRRTGKRRKLDRPESEWTRREAPELAILDAATWAALQARLDAQAARVKAAGNPSAANAPRRLFSGIARCGVCGAALQTTGPDRRYRCWARMQKGAAACSNGRTAPADRFEAEALAALRRDLLHPEVIEAFVLAYHQAQRARQAASAGDRARLTRALADAQGRAGRLVDQVAAGHLKGVTVSGKLAELEAEAGRLAAELARLAASAEVLTLHPRAAQRYRDLVGDLQAALGPAGTADNAHLDQARQLLRQVVRAVYLDPGDARGQWTARVDGDLTQLMQASGPGEAGARRA